MVSKGQWKSSPKGSPLMQTYKLQGNLHYWVGKLPVTLLPKLDYHCTVSLLLQSMLVCMAPLICLVVAQWKSISFFL